ncbi:hypothetical protein BN1708_020275, partial [Verticillium longisporum]
PAFHAVQLGG